MHTIFAFIVYLINKSLETSRRATIENYLAQSYDIFDLEQRIDKLARKGIL